MDIHLEQLERSRLGAIEESRQLLDAHPQSIEAHLFRGQALERINHIAEAENEYRRALTIDPQDHEAQRLLDRAAEIKTKSKGSNN